MRLGIFALLALGLAPSFVGASAQSTAPMGSVWGDVVGPDGRPVGQFQVTALATSDGREHGGAFDNASGRFRLVLPAGRFVMVVRAGRMVAARSVDVAPGRSTPVGRVPLGPPGSLHGIVEDDQGSPVAAARVEVLFDAESRALAGLGASDSQGGVDIAGIPSGRAVVRVSHPGHAETEPVEVEIQDESAPVNVRLVLPRLGRLAGRVLLGNGEGAAGLAVRFEPHRGRAREAHTDNRGRFVFERLVPGQASIELRTTSGEFLQSSLVGIDPSATTECEMVLSEVEVSGRISRDGRPVAGTRVRVSGLGHAGVWVSEPSDEEGRYAVTLHETGAFQLVVESADGRVRAKRRIELTEAGSHLVDLEIPASPLQGRIIDAASGAPVKAARVSAYPREGGSVTAAQAATTNGEFSLDVEPGNYHVDVTAPGYQSKSIEVEVPDAGAPGIRVALLVGRKVLGYVIDRTGRGTPLAAVAARCGAEEFAAGVRSDGGFLLEGLPFKPCTVMATGQDGFDTTTVASEQTEVLLRLRGGGQVALHVVGPDGLPAEAATAAVTAVEAVTGTPGALHVVDRNGDVTFPVPAGRVSVRVGKGWWSGLVEVEVGPGETVAAQVQLRDTR